jgi:hypothetical protein
MMKLNSFCCFLRSSTFVIRPARCALSGISASRVFLMNVTTTVSVQSVSQGRRVFCGLPTSGGFAFEGLRATYQYRNPALFKSRKSHALFLLIFGRTGAKRNYSRNGVMSKLKKTKKAAGGLALTPQEKELLDVLVGDLSRVDPSRPAPEGASPQFVEALVERLPVTDPQTPRILLGLRSLFREKNVAKAIKKAAFRLKQKGIVLPEEQDAEPSALKTTKQGETDLSAYLGPIDGTGSRPVFISVPQIPAGVDVAIGVVNDEEGIIEFAFTRYSKKRMREIKDLFFSKLPNMVQTTLSHAADVLERAYNAKAPGVSDSARAYLQFRPWLREHTSTIERPEAYRLLPPEAVSSDLLTESQLQRLFEHELMATWIIDLRSLRPLIEEIRKAEESRIFISEGQRLEHIHRIKYEGIPRIFSEARKQSLKYRLEETAYVFLKSGEESLGRLCLAASVTLSEKESPIKVNPFTQFLLERSLAYYLKSSTRPEKTSDRQSERLIVT